MKIVFMGTPEFAVPSLHKLIASGHDICAVYTQPDRPSGRGRQLHPSPVKAVALAAGIPVFQPLTLKNEEDLQQLAALNADLIVVVAYGMILTQAVLDLPPLGCINVHGSLLPRWRGAAPIQRSLMAGDEKTGVTIMKIVRKLDAGDMLHKEELLISDTDTSHDLYLKLADLGATGLAKVIQQLEEGTLNPEVQDEVLVTYAEKLDKAEATIDWTQSAEVISRKIRGLNPWPVAQTIYEGQVLRLWQAQALPENTDLAAGVMRRVNKHIEVGTGQGIVRLSVVQLPNGKPIHDYEFLNANTVDGVKLG
jgi:methionyl-tRNA formyltransferase